MTAIVVKVVDRTRPDLVAEAEGELRGAGFAISYREEGEFLGVDAVKHGGAEDAYGPAVVLIGTK